MNLFDYWIELSCKIQYFWVIFSVNERCVKSSKNDYLLSMIFLTIYISENPNLILLNAPWGSSRKIVCELKILLFRTGLSNISLSKGTSQLLALNGGCHYSHDTIHAAVLWYNINKYVQWHSRGEGLNTLDTSNVVKMSSIWLTVENSQIW